MCCLISLLQKCKYSDFLPVHSTQNFVSVNRPKWTVGNIQILGVHPG